MGVTTSDLRYLYKAEARDVIEPTPIHSVLGLSLNQICPNRMLQRPVDHPDLIVGEVFRKAVVVAHDVGPGWIPQLVVVPEGSARAREGVRCHTGIVEIRICIAYVVFCGVWVLAANVAVLTDQTGHLRVAAGPAGAPVDDAEEVTLTDAPISSDSQTG